MHGIISEMGNVGKEGSSWYCHYVQIVREEVSEGEARRIQQKWDLGRGKIIG